MKKKVVTTSWDDGHQLDFKLAAILKKYKIAGTFYISPEDREISKEDRLTDEQIVELGQDFEIGAHTMTHPILHSNFRIGLYRMLKTWLQSNRSSSFRIQPKISRAEAYKEIVDSKNYLEKLLGYEVSSFCYPDGRNSKVTQELVREAGFAYARSVERFEFGIPKNRYAAETSIHTYKHYQDLMKILSFSNWNVKTFLQNLDWEVLAKNMFDHVYKNGGVFHLWGHSWEIDENNDWVRLERVLSYIADHDDVLYIQNKDLKEVVDG